MSRITLIFSALFLLFTFGDAWSTNHALQAGFGQEFNPVMEDGSGGMIEYKFWIINIIALGMSAFMLEWAIRNRNYAGEKYLKNPLRASLNWVYLNPFSKANKPKAILHWPAMAIGLVLIKPFAILNNLNIAKGSSGFLDSAVIWLAQYLEGGLLYLAVISLVVMPLWIASLYVVAYMINKDQKSKLPETLPETLKGKFA